MRLGFRRRSPRDGPEARLRSRDRSAWEQLVAEEYVRVFNLHLRLTGDRDAASDLTQETFAAAYSSAHTYRGQCRPTAWLHGVALNCNRNRRRTAGRHDPPVQLDEELPDPDPTTEELAALRERRDLVCGAVRRLPEIYRRTVALRYFVGLSAAEIAAAEGVDAGTVRWRLHRATQKLWVMLKGSLVEENEDETGVQGRIHLAP